MKFLPGKKRDELTIYNTFVLSKMVYFKLPESFNVNKPQGWLKSKQKLEIIFCGRKSELEGSCLDIYNTLKITKQNLDM